jgi:hypothetical protein
VSKYLARLKALDSDKPRPREPSKPSKAPFVGFDGDTCERFQKTQRPFDGLDSSKGGRFSETLPAIERGAEILTTPQGTTVKNDENSREARAAALEASDLPHEWADPFAHLLCGPPPGDFDDAYWARVLLGANIFASEWAAKACALGWTAKEVFGLDGMTPAVRNDMKGLAWLLVGGARVVTLNQDGADIITNQSSLLRYYRRACGAIQTVD